MRITFSNASVESIRFTAHEAVVTKLSPISGKFHTAIISVTEAQYSEWLEGELIQNALSSASGDEREFLMTGITPQEWEAEFGEDQ